MVAPAGRTVLPGAQRFPPRGSELPGRRGIAVSPLPPGPAQPAIRPPPLAPLTTPGARGPGHGPRCGPAARREAWLGGRPLAAPPPGLLGRHEDGRGGHESDPRGRRLRRAGDKEAMQ
ncbi:hypothetical protein R6Z07F_018581 [Ovis aries]